MARAPRINLAGGLFHVTQRGNNRQPIFLDDKDRRAFLERVARFRGPFKCSVHAYCLMDNHVHLLLETQEANLSAFAQRLFASYTLWFNRKHEQVGHVFQGRFKSILVEKDAYLLELSRYIHLNPVKAKLVAKPEEYRWSSMRSYLGMEGVESWVTTRDVLAYFTGRRQEYLAFVHGRMGVEDPGFITRGDCLGSHAFIEEVQTQFRNGEHQRTQALDRKTEDAAKLAKVSRLLGMDETTMRKKHAKGRESARARAMLGYVLRRTTSMTHAEIGRVLGGVSAAGVASQAEKVARLPKLRDKADRIIKITNA